MPRHPATPDALPNTAAPDGAAAHMPTAHERAASDLMARLAGSPTAKWRPVRVVEVGVWYDWADPATGTVGQCRAGAGGGWVQAPRGAAPVVLQFRASRWPR